MYNKKLENKKKIISAGEMENNKRAQEERTYYCSNCGDLLSINDLVNGTCTCQPLSPLLVINRKIRYKEYKTNNQTQTEFMYRLKDMCYCCPAQTPFANVIEETKRSILVELGAEDNQTLIAELDKTLETNLNAFMLNLTLFEVMELATGVGEVGERLLQLIDMGRVVGLRMAKDLNYYSMYSLQSTLDLYLATLK